MYYYLHGMITMHTSESIVVEAGGVGYDVLVAHPEDFPVGENLFVFVSYFSHEDDQYFVGFRTLEEKKIFLALTSVKGIGAKTGLSILANTSVVRLKQAIKEKDTRFLMRLPGIGQKSASQIILDLSGKLDTLLLKQDEKDSKALADAKEALRQLGFKEHEIKDAIEKIDEKNLTSEEYIARALRELRK